VDCTAAFVQAPIEEDLYVDPPRGFPEPGKVLKLKKSLYGLKQSPNNFFQHLNGNLESIGFMSNDDLDPCLFVSDKVIALVYIDDTLFYSPKQESIDDVINGLRECGMEMDVEDDVAGFLGVDIQDRRHVDGTIKLTQLGLAKRVYDRKCIILASSPSTRDYSTISTCFLIIKLLTTLRARQYVLRRIVQTV
jgi:hypothetical protein